MLTIDSFVNIGALYFQFHFSNKMYLKVCSQCHSWIKRKVYQKARQRLVEKIGRGLATHTQIVNVNTFSSDYPYYYFNN